MDNIGDSTSLESENANGPDDRVTDWMIAYDDSLSTRKQATDSSVLESQIPLETRPELADVKNCLDQLAALRGAITAPELPRVAFKAPESVRTDVTRVGQFEIVETLGVGGFGIVYRAWDPITQREVALKVPRPEALASPELQRRFEHEARAAAKLDHPYIVPVLEAGIDGHVPYIAAVYYRAITLAAWLKEQTRPIPPRGAAELVARLADALNHAHVRGVLHRDMKPSNVLLIPIEPATSATMLARLPLSDYVPKITDFGLAKLAEGVGDHTCTGMVLGTLLYMSPEQAEGCVREISEQSDVYALGAVLYELLTRRPPHCGENDRGTLHQILMQEPVAPSRSAPQVPSDLNAICLKCLEKRPADRYPSALELAADLNRFLAGQPTKVRPLGAPQQLARWARLRPAIAALTSVLCAALLTIFVGAVMYNSRLRHSLAEVSAQRAVAEQAVQDTKLTLYAADMQRAQQAWRHNHITQVAQFLAAHEPQPGEPDRREFSWYYLRELCHRQIAALVGHEGDVFSVAASPDGKQWASGGKDRTVRLWDMATRRQRTVWEDHTDEVTQVAFSPDGQSLASSSEDGTIRIRSVTATTAPRVIQAYKDHVLGLAWSPDGKLLASCGREKPLRIWNAATLELVRELEAEEALFEAVTFSRNGARLIAGNDRGVAFCWNVADWSLFADTRYPSEQYFTLATSPADDLVAGAGRLRRIPLWRAEGGQLQEAAELRNGHQEWIQALAFSPRDRILASADKAGVIQLWNIDSQARHSVLGHVDQIWSLAWSPDGKILASAGGAGLIRLWDGTSRPDASVIYPPLDMITMRVVYTADGKSLLTSNTEGRLGRYDVERCVLVDSFVRRGDLYRSLVSSRAGEFIASHDSYSAVGIAPVANGPPTLIPDSADIRLDSAIAVSLDGRRLAWSDDENKLTVSNLDSSDRFCIETTARVDFAEFAPDNVHVALSSKVEVQIWNCESQKQSLSLPPGGLMVFSPDGSLLMVERNAELSAYDAKTGRVLQTFVNRPARIASMAVSPDNKSLAIVDRTSNEVTLLDLRSGQELLALQVESRELRCVTFSARGDRLVASGMDEDRQGRIWEWSIDRAESLRQTKD